MNEEAARIYQGYLAESPVAENARSYLAERGVPYRAAKLLVAGPKSGHNIDLAMGKIRFKERQSFDNKRIQLNVLSHQFPGGAGTIGLFKLDVVLMVHLNPRVSGFHLGDFKEIAAESDH